MITFSVAILLLIMGYVVYGKVAERIIKPDAKAETPAYRLRDNVDFLPLPTWKIFMIQFLNIAGLGPIFGAIMGAQFGTSSYLWIVFGTIFAGAVHDYMSGMISLKNSGESLPEIIGRFLGKNTKKIFGVFTIVLMVLVGAVFVYGPAKILASITPDFYSALFWMVVIFIYYILATMLPIDKIIGKIYPLFAVALIFTAVGILASIYIYQPDLPEIWDGLGTKYEKNPIFPMMFVSIACGAISGFHATQSPLMARCMTNEKHGRPIFYGAMITEGIVALIWAAAAICFYAQNGVVDVAGKAYDGATIAKTLSYEWLGTFGGILAVLGIVAAPITSGDTALRSARLIIADFFHFDQKKISRRLVICFPLFLVTMSILIYSINDEQGFNVIWRYFAWSNQTLSVFTLWAVTVYLVRNKKFFWVTLIPALFMTCVCSTYLLVAPECFALNVNTGYIGGGLLTLVSLLLFVLWFNKVKRCSQTKA